MEQLIRDMQRYRNATINWWGWWSGEIDAIIGCNVSNNNKNKNNNQEEEDEQKKQETKTEQ